MHCVARLYVALLLMFCAVLGQQSGGGILFQQPDSLRCGQVFPISWCDDVSRLRFVLVADRQSHDPQRRTFENEGAVKDGDTVQIELADYASSLNIKTIATLGIVVHPVKTFNYSVPEVIPAEWTSKKFIFQIRVLSSPTPISNNPKTAYWVAFTIVCNVPVFRVTQPAGTCEQTFGFLTARQ